MMGRPSFSQGGNSRKSIQPRTNSISTASRLPDPRNIGEKEFMNRSIKQLIEYLTKHGYDGAVSPKILSKPATKDFTSIVLFLFRQLDPNYKHTGKFEDEMIAMFKYLGYPFPIAKSNISAVGSPHAWPTLLGCIMWLVDLLNYSEATNIAIAESDLDADSDPSASEKGFYRYLGKAYELFLSGKDDQYAQLEEQFIASFDNKNTLIKDQIEGLDKRNQALTAEIEEVKNRGAYLPELVQKKKEFQQNFTQFSTLMEELKKHRDQLKDKNDQRLSELSSLQNASALLVEEIDTMNDRILNQDLSPEDVQNMVTERQRLEEAHQQASENRQALLRTIKDLEGTLRNKVANLEESARLYQSHGEDLKLLPPSARNARGHDLSIEIDIRAKKREGLMKTDVQRSIIPILKQMKAELNDTTLSLRAEMMQEQEEAEDIHMRRSELQEAQTELDAKLKRAEAGYKREKELLDQSASIHRKEMDTMEARLVQLQDTAVEEARITAARRRIAECNAIRSARRKEHERKKASMEEAVMDVVTHCASHREMVQAQLEQLKMQYTNRLQTFLVGSQMQQPFNAPVSYVSVSNDILSGAIPVTDLEKVLQYQFLPSSAQDATGGVEANKQTSPNAASVVDTTNAANAGDATNAEEIEVSPMQSSSRMSAAAVAVGSADRSTRSSLGGDMTSGSGSNNRRRMSTRSMTSSAAASVTAASTSPKSRQSTGTAYSACTAATHSFDFMDVYPQPPSAFKNEAKTGEDDNVEEEEDDDEAVVYGVGEETLPDDLELLNGHIEVSTYENDDEGENSEMQGEGEDDQEEEEGQLREFAEEEEEEGDGVEEEEQEEGEDYDTVEFAPLNEEEEEVVDYMTADFTQNSMQFNPRRSLYSNFDDAAIRDRRMRSENKKYRKSMA